MRTYFKAVRESGGSFNSPNFVWSTMPGGVTTHPSARRGSEDASNYLSVATVATDCTGFSWPCRLLEVAPVGRTWSPHPTDLPSKRAGVAFRTVRELPAWQVFGAQGEYVAALIERTKVLSAAEVQSLSAAWYAARDAARDAAWYAAGDAAWYAARDAAWYAARDAAWYAARSAAWYAARSAAWYAAGSAARDAAWALTLRDLIGTGTWSREHYNTLVGPWAKIIGPAHPEDAL